MNNLDAVFYFFVVVVAIIAILVGREFIRARRERASERPEEDKDKEAVEVSKAPAVEEEAEEEADEPAREEAEEEADEPAREEAEEEADEPAREETEEEADEPAREEAEGKKEEGAPAKPPTPKKAKDEPKAGVAKEEKTKDEPEPEPAAVAVAQPVPKPEPPKKEAFETPDTERRRLKKGLTKTRGGFVSRLGRLFKGKKELPPDIMDKLEEVLFTADIGVKTSEKLFRSVKEALGKKELKDADMVWAHIKAESQSLLDIEASSFPLKEHKPFVILTIGVNGVGKTTTIGKVASKLAKEGKSVLLAAGDTFRAAAVEQLTVWGDRVGCPVVKGKQESDPSAVIFDGIKKAEEEGIDVVIADTAGRLHTKVSLMEELKKIHRVMGKAAQGAPHETLLVLDATNGQNAIQQAHLFREAVDFTSIALTKLDGTAKGGIILGICDELNVPVRYVGIGERVEDLREFSPERFVEALYADSEESS